MTISIALAGISNNRSGVQELERLHLTPEEAATLSRSLSGSMHEAVVLYTCNRTEIYVAAPDITQALERARRALTELCGVTVPQSAFYACGGQAAAAHLFRVAAGLESIVLGDTHVAGQVRRAFQAAHSAGATGPLLDRLFQAASAASKRVRSHTSLSTGSTSVPNIQLFNLDDLARIGVADGERRRGQVDRADAIVQAEAERYAAWQQWRAGAPAIRTIRHDDEVTRRVVLARHTTALMGRPSSCGDR